jgi:hypothetical protein
MLLSGELIAQYFLKKYDHCLSTSHTTVRPRIADKVIFKNIAVLTLFFVYDDCKCRLCLATNNSAPNLYNINPRPNLYVFPSVVLQVANVADVLGVAKKTPMGIFLKEWGVEPDLKYIS